MIKYTSVIDYSSMKCGPPYQRRSGTAGY